MEIMVKSDFDCLTDRSRILKIKNEGKGRSPRVHHYWPKVAFWRSAASIGLPSPTFRAGPNCCQISILVLCFVLQEGQQDRRRNHFREEGRRKDSRSRQELRHLGSIRFAIWNSQHVPWIPRHEDRRRRHSVLPRYGCSPSSSTWIHPDPSSRTTSRHQRRWWEAGSEASIHHSAFGLEDQIPSSTKNHFPKAAERSSICHETTKHHVKRFFENVLRFLSFSIKWE